MKDSFGFPIWTSTWIPKDTVVMLDPETLGNIPKMGPIQWDQDLYGSVAEFNVKLNVQVLADIAKALGVPMIVARQQQDDDPNGRY